MARGDAGGNSDVMVEAVICDDCSVLLAMAMMLGEIIMVAIMAVIVPMLRLFFLWEPFSLIEPSTLPGR